MIPFTKPALHHLVLSTQLLQWVIILILKDLRGEVRKRGKEEGREGRREGGM